ncbi:hypothetical protein SESBI_04730 [Sesbania bispinosa]|nr:hypothetical protein SESBI_04730 [Sesbania bispinosa]
MSYTSKQLSQSSRVLANKPMKEVTVQGEFFKIEGNTTFVMNYARWSEEHYKLVSEIKSALNDHDHIIHDDRLQILVNIIMKHYSELFQMKTSAAANVDAFNVGSAIWCRTAEPHFWWIGGFRPSELLQVILPQLQHLCTQQQLSDIFNLGQSCQQAEEALAQGMEKLQQILDKATAAGDKRFQLAYVPQQMSFLKQPNPMVVKMMRWPPWPPLSSKKFEAVVIVQRLQGSSLLQPEEEVRSLVVEIKWKGQKGVALSSLRRSMKRNFTTEVAVRDAGLVEWNQEFRNVCTFTGYKENMFYPWEVMFTLSNVSNQGPKTRASVAGVTSINLAEYVPAAVDKETEIVVPLNVPGLRRVKIFTDYVSTGRAKKASSKDEGSDCRSSNRSEDSEYRYTSDTDSLDNNDAAIKSEENEEDSCVRHSLSYETLASGNCVGGSPYTSSTFNGSWEHKEVISRDGKMKLHTQIFFASIDQRSERAAGESACAVLVAFIADWLRMNQVEMPIKCEFDSLIKDGSSEWRILCENKDYMKKFPDKHFDLDTVLQAKIRPVSVVPEKSFVGFFIPEEFEGGDFEFLHGAMSFDNIWEEISHSASELHMVSEPLVYIVSWNDHFFVLKVEQDAYYIIDTLGERLHEGCNQAYILKFDTSTKIEKLHNENQTLEPKSVSVAVQINGSEENVVDGAFIVTPNDRREEIICRGKESCKEYIKSFLAAIPVRELQGDVKKGLKASMPFHHRLQIEFHYTKLK